MKPYVILLILNIVAIIVSFMVAFQGPDAGTAMLPFIYLPIIGAVSVVCLTIITIFHRKVFAKHLKIILLAAFILLINLWEMRSGIDIALFN